MDAGLAVRQLRGRHRARLSGRSDETEWFARAHTTFFYDDDLFIWHRRDGIALWPLCRSQFKKNKIYSKGMRKAGIAYRPRPERIPRLLFHGLRKRCAKGYVMAAQEAGAAVGWAGDRLRRRP